MSHDGVVSDDFCTRHNNQIIRLIHLTISILNILGAILVTWLLCLHIHGYIKKRLTLSNKLFIVTTIFYLICLISLLISACENFINPCSNEDLQQRLKTMVTQLYAFQTILLCGILYHRLFFIFRGTVHQVSKCTNISFWIFYTLTTVVFAVRGIVYMRFPEISTITSPIAFALMLMNIIFLDTSFILKLYKAAQSMKSQKMVHNKDTDFINTITKNSILALISTSLTFVMSFIIALFPVFNAVDWEIMIEIIYIPDVLSNVFCVALTLTYFQPYYDRICGYCHKKCLKLWRLWIEQLDEMHIIETIKMDGQMSSSRPTSGHNTIDV